MSLALRQFPQRKKYLVAHFRDMEIPCGFYCDLAF